jgi:transposase
MSMGKRKATRQGQLWVETAQLASSPGHPFYARLNTLLDGEGFDVFVEGLCAEFYAARMGRPSLPPAVYFRLLLIGYFEGLDSERRIAWRVADSLSLRRFCGYDLTERTPDHSTISGTRRLLSDEVHDEVFGWVLKVLSRRGLIRGKTLGLDATTLEANAAMGSIVRRDSGASYPEYLEALAQAEGVAETNRRELARRDRKRKKKASNRDWQNPQDPDARITKMKDGRTHLAHKAEHAVDLESGAVVAVTVQPADRGDTTSQEETLEEAARHLGDLAAEDGPAQRLAQDHQLMKELVADRGYHSDAVLESCDKLGIRTYIPEPKRPRRRWRGRKEAAKRLYANRRRTRGNYGRKLSRQRAEKAERSFAHCYETGGMRRIHLRGHENIRKRILIHVAAFNLGLALRQQLGAGTPRGLRALVRRLFLGLLASFKALARSLWAADRSARWRPAKAHLVRQSLLPALTGS